VIARKARKLAELCVAAVVQRLLPREKEQARKFEPDPATSARIRAYTALSMKERYGEHGP
jgi:hypothetical protein